MRLDDLATCFEGVYPSVIATRSADGMPCYLLHVAQVDDRRIAVSNQFFAKTAARISAQIRTRHSLSSNRERAENIILLWFGRSPWNKGRSSSKSRCNCTSAAPRSGWWMSCGYGLWTCSLSKIFCR